MDHDHEYPLCALIGRVAFAQPRTMDAVADDMADGLDFDRYRPTYILIEANDPLGIADVLDPLYELRAKF
jgi:hypothetical protein